MGFELNSCIEIEEGGSRPFLVGERLSGEITRVNTQVVLQIIKHTVRAELFNISNMSLT